MSLKAEGSDALPVLLARIRADLTVRATSIGIMDLNDEDSIILLMGPPGSGKTTFLETVAGTAVAGRKNSEHYTTGISACRLSAPGFPVPDVVLVNVPALNDTGKLDIEILQMISGWLNRTYKRGILISGAIYFHRISDVKLQGTAMRNWLAFEGICGHHFNKVVVATTMWGDVDDELGGRRMEDLEDIWRVSRARGWSRHPFLRNRPSAAEVLSPILIHPTKRPLQLQREVCYFNLPLKQTTAAQALVCQLAADLHTCERNHAKFIKDLKRTTDPKEIGDLEEELHNLARLVVRIRAAILALTQTPMEQFQRFLFLTMRLGPIFRHCSPKPELGKETDGTGSGGGTNNNVTKA